MCSVWICIVCLHQSFQPLECVYFDPENPSMVNPTGESCLDKSDCAASDEAFRDCSRIGLFGVGSVGPRVRYTGILQDPNEVAMLVASCIPIAIAFTELRPTFWRKVGLAVFSVLVVLTVQATQSRGGQLVLAAVVLTYTVKRYGLARAASVLAPLALVGLVLLSGGGGGREDAEESSLKRLGCMLAGTEMLWRSPLTGVGWGQFQQYHDQTAHNAYILAAAETGFLGLLLWTLVAYGALRGLYDLGTARGAEPRARAWSIALATSLTGMFVGIFFLSFTYHLVLWVFFGLAVSLHACLGPRVPRRITIKEVLLLAVACLLTMVTVYFYAQAKVR
jgi:O-antigen ligase